MEQPIIEIITDDNGNARRGAWLQDGNQQCLFVEPPPFTMNDAKRLLELDALQADLKAAQAESARLQFKINQMMLIATNPRVSSYGQLIAEMRQIGTIAREALQPAEVSHE